jgi:hypothetical protein
MEIKNLLFQQLARIRVAEKRQELESRGVAGVVDRAAGENAVVGASRGISGYGTRTSKLETGKNIAPNHTGCLKNLHSWETKTLGTCLVSQECRLLFKHPVEYLLIAVTLHTDTVIQFTKSEVMEFLFSNFTLQNDYATGIYILAFCAFYYSAIFSALQLFTELFSIGYSKLFVYVYLHPTPLLNAKLIRFGPLLTKNH